jgi:hypothetical protein
VEDLPVPFRLPFLMLGAVASWMERPRESQRVPESPSPRRKTTRSSHSAKFRDPPRLSLACCGPGSLCPKRLYPCAPILHTNVQKVVRQMVVYCTEYAIQQSKIARLSSQDTVVPIVSSNASSIRMPLRVRPRAGVAVSGSPSIHLSKCPLTVNVAVISDLDALASQV